MAEKERASKACTRGKRDLDKGRPLQAMLAFTEAIKCDDEHYESYLGRADAFLQLEYHYMARDDAQKCIDLRPNSMEGYLKKGKVEFAAEAYKDARETYEKALDVDSHNEEILAALHQTNKSERGQMFYEKRLHMQGTGVGSFVGIIFLLINEIVLNPQVIQGIIMKGIVFGACAYLGYAATKFYTDLLKQQRDLMLEKPKEVQSDPFAGLAAPTPAGNNPAGSKKKR